MASSAYAGNSVAGAERLADILAWVKETVASELALSSLSDAEQGPDAVEVLERIRTLTITRNHASTAAAEDAAARAREYARLADVAEPRRRVIEEHLTEPDVLADADELAGLASALSIPLRHAVDPRAYAVALGDLVERVTQERVDADRYELEAEVALRELVRAMHDAQNAGEVLEQTEEALTISLQSAKLDLQRERQLTAKTEQYESETGELRTQVRATGITADITHDAVLQVSNECEEVEAKCRQLAKELKVFHELPPDILLAKRKVQDVSHEIEQLEEDIKATISAITS